MAFKLREWRQYRDLSQAKAAELAGIRQDTWSRIELGRVSRPHTTTLRAIAGALRCAVSDLQNAPPNHREPT